MGVHIPWGEEEEVLGVFAPNSVNSVFECIFVFDSCVKSSQYLRVDNISLDKRKRLIWRNIRLSEGIVNFEIEVGIHDE